MSSSSASCQLPLAEASDPPGSGTTARRADLAGDAVVEPEVRTNELALHSRRRLSFDDRNRHLISVERDQSPSRRPAHRGTRHARRPCQRQPAGDGYPRPRGMPPWTGSATWAKQRVPKPTGVGVRRMSCAPTIQKRLPESLAPGSPWLPHTPGDDPAHSAASAMFGLKVAWIDVAENGGCGEDRGQPCGEERHPKDGRATSAGLE